MKSWRLCPIGDKMTVFVWGDARVSAAEPLIGWKPHRVTVWRAEVMAAVQTEVTWQRSSASASVYLPAAAAAAAPLALPFFSFFSFFFQSLRAARRRFVFHRRLFSEGRAECRAIRSWLLIWAADWLCRREIGSMSYWSTAEMVIVI